MKNETTTFLTNFQYIFPRVASVQLKVIKGLSVFYHYVRMNFRLRTKNLQELFTQLDVDDQQTFFFDHKTIDWEKYHDNGIRGIRKFLLKDDESTMEKAQRKLKMFYYANLFCKAFFSVVALQCVFKFGVFLYNKLIV